MGQWLNGLGHGKAICKSDQEQAIVDLVETARADRMTIMEEIVKNIQSIRGFEDENELPPAVMEHSLVGGSKSNGAVENATKRVQGQVRQILTQN